MKVVLTRKLAEAIDGIDVAGCQVGDVLDLRPAEARLLIAEEWAIPDRRLACRTPPAAERRRTTFQSRQRGGDSGLERAS